MKIRNAAWLLTIVIAGPLLAAPPARRLPPHKNRSVALLAGAALHLAQDARALQSAALRKREKEYGPNDAQVKAGHRNLRTIRHNLRYFRAIKRHSEGRSPSFRPSSPR